MREQSTDRRKGFQPPFGQDPENLPFTMTVATIAHMIEYKKRIPDNTEWVLIRTDSHVVRNGRYDIDVFVLDLEGEILALCRQCVQAWPRKTSGKI
jgi:acyl-CoA thioesterase